MARICVVTAGHLSTCPRMLKAADALAEAGHRVRVVSTRHTPWATATDRDVRTARGNTWAWSEVSYDRRSAMRYLRTGARFRGAQWFAKRWPRRRWPLWLAARAYSRAHPELVRQALSEPADLYYGGTNGALAAVAVAARRAGVPYALDLEDFHGAEYESIASAALDHALTRRIEGAVLNDAIFVTAGSAAIAEAYVREWRIDPIPINNTFPLPSREPTFARGDGQPLRLYWFSQTIGPGRGLEDAIVAMGMAVTPGELYLRGRPVAGYVETLLRLAEQSAPLLRIIRLDPATPDSMVDLCREYDIGLALEPGVPRHNALALSNKTLTYVLAGLAMVLTDTSGHRPLAGHLAPHAIIYAPGDVRALGEGLRRWAADRALLLAAKVAAWQAACRRWHWQHPAERGALLGAVTDAVGVTHTAHAAPAGLRVIDGE